MQETAPEQIPNLFSMPDTEIVYKPKWYKKYAWFIGACLLAFFGGLFIINSYLARTAIIHHIKNGINYTIISLNLSGWDIAYDEIDFNASYPADLFTVKNLKIYDSKNNATFFVEFPLIEVNTRFFNAQKFDISFPQGIVITKYDGKHFISANEYEFSIEMTEKFQFSNLTFQSNNVKITDFADIGTFTFASRIIAPQQINDSAPFLKIFAEAENISLNGLLDYPLSQNIDRIYLDSDMLGKFSFEDNFAHGFNIWQSQGGEFEINDFTINWRPLLLVGKGNLYFNDHFRPILNLNTSSKALINLLDDLEQKNWLDSKGVFVAKILLNNKAYKADPDDEYLTVTSPIAIQEDALLVEKISVKKWKNN